VNAVLDRTRFEAPTEADTGCWTTDYALHHCEGALVDGPGGHVGFVSEVVETDDSIELVVQAGADELHIPASAIEYVDPLSDRVVIAGGGL
jgi:hypothetical protein